MTTITMEKHILKRLDALEDFAKEIRAALAAPATAQAQPAPEPPPFDEIALVRAVLKGYPASMARDDAIRALNVIEGRPAIKAPATAPEQPRPFIPWSKEAEMLESWAAQPATAPAQPAWHDAPTCEGMWVNMMSGRLIVITEETLEAWQNAAVRWYGPIPEDSQ